jgi:ATP-dependent Clp protease adaptor protein ClpS
VTVPVAPRTAAVMDADIPADLPANLIPAADKTCLISVLLFQPATPIQYGTSMAASSPPVWHSMATPRDIGPRDTGARGPMRAHGGNNPTRRDGTDQDGQSDNPDSPTIGVVVRTRPQTRKPAMYKVLMLNDDYTPMEFVVHVLERFFQKSREEATDIMLHVHKRGVGVCGVFTYEVAETKVTQVMDLARQNQHPLQCTIEKD